MLCNFQDITARIGYLIDQVIEDIVFLNVIVSHYQTLSLFATSKRERNKLRGTL